MQQTTCQQQLRLEQSLVSYHPSAACAGMHAGIDPDACASLIPTHAFHWSRRMHFIDTDACASLVPTRVLHLELKWNHKTFLHMSKVLMELKCDEVFSTLSARCRVPRHPGVPRGVAACAFTRGQAGQGGGGGGQDEAGSGCTDCARPGTHRCHRWEYM